MRYFFQFFVPLLCIAMACTQAPAQTPLVQEDFDYPAGTILNAQSGYSVRSGANVNVQAVIAPGLTYPGYAGSGIGNCDSLTTNGEDLSKDYVVSPNPGISSGSVYLAALVKVVAAQATGDFFLTLHYNNTFNGKVFVRSTTGGFYFGTAKNTAVYDTTKVCSFDSTYLVVVKYTFNSGTNDDRVDFWVNPPIGGTEPAPVAPLSNITDAARSDYSNIGGFAIRQGTSTSAPTVKVDGIRLATDWATAVASSVTDVAEETSAPLEFRLMQNYPNPFNPSTQIEFSVGKTGHATLEVYTMLGQRAAVLFDGVAEGGRYHTVRMDGSNLSSGIYFSLLRSNGQATMRRMVLLK